MLFLALVLPTYAEVPTTINPPCTIKLVHEAGDEGSRHALAVVDQRQTDHDNLRQHLEAIDLRMTTPYGSEVGPLGEAEVVWEVPQVVAAVYPLEDRCYAMQHWVHHDLPQWSVRFSGTWRQTRDLAVLWITEGGLESTYRWLVQEKGYDWAIVAAEHALRTWQFLGNGNRNNPSIDAALRKAANSEQEVRAAGEEAIAGAKILALDEDFNYTFLSSQLMKMWVASDVSTKETAAKVAKDPTYAMPGSAGYYEAFFLRRANVNPDLVTLYRYYIVRVLHTIISGQDPEISGMAARVRAEIEKSRVVDRKEYITALVEIEHEAP